MNGKRSRLRAHDTARHMRYSSKANEFATQTKFESEENNDENEHPNFESLARESTFHDFTVNASKQLDAEIESAAVTARRAPIIPKF